MKRIAFVIFVLPVLLFSEWDHLFKGAGDPALAYHVNVITGNLQLFFEDQIVEGAVPIHLHRTYSSAGHYERTVPKDPKLKKLNTIWQLEGGWDFLPHLQLLVDPRVDAEDFLRVYLKEPNGEMITYRSTGKKSHHKLIMKPEKRGGQNFGVISGRLNPNNHRLHINYKKGKATLHLANGGKRIYKGEERSTLDAISDSEFYGFQRKLRYYLLDEEISPSGQRTLFTYSEEGKCIEIAQRNPANTKTYSSATIRQINDKPPFNLQIRTSDKRGVIYEGWSFKDQDYLSSVKSSSSPPEIISYTKLRKGLGASVEHIATLEREKIRIDYYRPLSEKDSKKWAKKPSKKRFETDKVKAIIQGDIVVASFTYLPGVTDVRDCNQILTRYHYKKGELDLIEYFDQNDLLYSSQSFFWSDGNLTCKAMCDDKGNTLYSKTFSYNSYGDVVKETLIEADQYSKWYEYDSNTHLLVQEREENGLTYKYNYLQGTDLVTTKLVCDGDEVLIRNEFTYDDDCLLTKEIAGHFEKTYERNSETGMIFAIEEGGKRTEYSYSIHNQVIGENVFDEKGEYRYSIHYNYDKYGHLIYKTTPSGLANKYTYDVFGNLLTSKEVGSPQKSFTYDVNFRPTACTINGKTSYTTYDPKGLVISQTDPLGNTTKYTYDAFGRCRFMQLPEVMEYNYDIAGNCTYYKNLKGEVKETSYNVLGKPLKERFPDGSEIHHIYNPNGTLRETIHQDGSKTEYEYDLFQRLLFNGTERWYYSPTQLLSYTDPRGLTTTYAYDKYGRKVSEEALDRKTTYTYDALGFLESTMIGDVTYTLLNDVEGKVIQEENTFYTYDNENRKIKVVKKTSEGEAIDIAQYDSEGRVVSHTDPYQSTTQFIYDDQTKTVIDPLGNIMLETYDRLGHVIQVEKKTPKGETVFLEKLFYDLSGNLNKKMCQDTEVSWEYDFRGLVVKESQSDKSTYYEYDLCGRLIKRILPSGTQITSSYDKEGRLAELFSSDKTIHYQYHYGLGPDPIKIENKIEGTALTRRYNLFGELIQEGILRWEYDNLGRKTCFTLPDNSKILYEYRDKHMTSVMRLSSDGKLLYKHTYDSFDINGHVSKESLIGNLGTVSTKHDLLERPYLITSPFHKFTLSYGSSGLVATKENSFFGAKHYDYDALNQLVKEEDHEYHFDSLGNPTDSAVNEHNELIDQFLYDPNGNPIKRLDSSLQYEYDALGRLTAILDGTKKVEFTYDAYSRLVSKTSSQDKKQFYLYDQEYEIGSMDESGNVLNLKALGLGVEGDIGAAIAVEIGGKVYAPLHDFQGNIIALVSLAGDIAATYNYDAFGNEDQRDNLTPWGFCSKRKEAGLIYFGKRFYDPSLGRWLTPDPLGCIDSLNVYLYTLNSPLNRLDLFGLSSHFYFHPSEQFKYSSGLYASPPPAPIKIHGFLTNGYHAAHVDCVVFSNSIHQIHFTPIERVLNHANLTDHMSDLIPKQKGIFGIITAANGVNNSLNESETNFQMIMNNVPEGTFFIGLYNESEGLIKDVFRSLQEVYTRKMTPNAVKTGLFLGGIADILQTIGSESLWLHLPHSESGVLFNLGHTMLSEKQKSVLQDQLYVFAIAPAEPISWKKCFAAQNVYSSLDGVTGFFGLSHSFSISHVGALMGPLITTMLGGWRDNPNCDIRFIKCRSALSELTAGFADHGMLGTTYRNITSDKVKNLRDRVGFYDTRKR